MKRAKGWLQLEAVAMTQRVPEVTSITKVYGRGYKFHTVRDWLHLAM